MSKFSSLGDLKKKSEDEKKRNELFVGGLDERGGGSGLAVLGPPGPNSGSNGRPVPGGMSSNILDRIVERAQQGASDEVDAKGPAEHQRTITLYRNGFVVDNGPFRDLNAPENQAFVSSLERGEVPAEMAGDRAGDDVDVALTDKRSEDYVPPPAPAYVAFSSGTALGVSARTDGSSAWVADPKELLGVTRIPVDESRPTTTLQIRTSDGKRLKIKLNNDSSVLQLALTIQDQGALLEAVVLSSGFPPKDLTDPGETLAGAGLVGAAITLKKAI